MTKCPDCKLEKQDKDFGKNSSRPSGKQNYCKDCMKIRSINSYRKHKKEYFLRAYDRNKFIDNLINTAKDRPCTDCGVKYPPYVMDFDHIESLSKLNKISTMRRRKMAIEKIRTEMGKCELVCANCHRERTNKRNPARYNYLKQ